jgi:type II secretory pathway component PulJ
MAHRDEMRASLRTGYTLIEIVVATFLFSVGGLALVATSAIVGRSLSVNAARERAGRIAATRLEILRAGCRGAVSGREKVGRIESEWSVGFSDSSHLRVLESITYPAQQGAHTDLYSGTVPCPP